MEKKNNLDPQYNNLLKNILENGIEKQTRNGNVISVFGRQFRHKMSDGFPLLTGKKMFFKGIVTELLWFLRGDTNIKYLVDNGCHIWDGDAYKNYHKQWKTEETQYTKNFNTSLPLELIKERDLTKEEFINKIKTDDEFAKTWGELGPIYGKQWRNWEKCELTNDDDFGDDTSWGDWNIKQIDQIANSIHLLKTDPDSRRNKVSAWNVGELDQMVLPPCHTDFQFYTRELSLEERCDEYIKRHPKETNDGVLNYKWIGDNLCTHEDYDKWNIPTRAISLMWNQRSVDTFLGLPFNIASYGLLLEIIAKEVNMVPDELIGNLGDVHLYSNHIEQAKEQIGKEFTEEEIIEHLQQSGMDALKNEPRMEYISKLLKRTREPFKLPTLKILNNQVDDIAHYEIGDFELENYQSHPAIKAPLSN